MHQLYLNVTKMCRHLPKDMVVEGEGWDSNNAYNRNIVLIYKFDLLMIINVSQSYTMVASSKNDVFNPGYYHMSCVCTLSWSRAILETLEMLLDQNHHSWRSEMSITDLKPRTRFLSYLKNNVCSMTAPKRPIIKNVYIPMNYEYTFVNSYGLLMSFYCCLFPNQYIIKICNFVAVSCQES